MSLYVDGAGLADGTIRKLIAGTAEGQGAGGLWHIAEQEQEQELEQASTAIFGAASF